MTLESWANLPEDTEGELVDGVLVEDEVTDFVHDAIVAFLIAEIRAWLRPSGESSGGFIAASDVKFRVSSSRGRKPDISVYLPGAPRPPATGLVTVPPSVMIEVVSPRPRDARRDRVDKFDEYAAFGVRFYWIVDRALRSIEIYERGTDGRYARALSAASGIVSVIPGCDGLTLDLDALWREVDELESTSD
jgi:Uma2 family endonuclease